MIWWDGPFIEKHDCVWKNLRKSLDGQFESLSISFHFTFPLQEAGVDTVDTTTQSIEGKLQVLAQLVEKWLIRYILF